MVMAIELEALESQIARSESTAVLQGETWVLDLKQQLPDDEGRLMLHHAAEHSSSEAVLQAVYEANPAAAAVLDKSSRLPLVIGLEHKTPCTDEQALILIDSAAAEVVDGKGSHLLHHVARHGRSVAVLSKAFESSRAAAGVLDEHGCLPMTTLLNSKCDDDQALVAITESAAAVADADGQLLLHHAVRHGRSLVVVKAVLAADVKAAAALDKSSRLPLVIGLAREPVCTDEESIALVTASAAAVKDN